MSDNSGGDPARATELEKSPTTSPQTNPSRSEHPGNAPPGEVPPPPDSGKPRPAAGQGWTWKRGLVLAVVVILLVIAGAFGLRYWEHSRHFESTDDAFIDGDVVRMAPRVSGQVLNLLVTDNQTVQPGQLLLEIDPADYRTKLAQAQAQEAEAQGRLAQARAQVEVAGANLQQAQAQLLVAQANAANAASDLRRYRELGPRAISQQTLDAAATTQRNTQAQVTVANRQITAAQAQIDLANSQIAVGQADCKATQAQVEQDKLQLSYAKLFAPVAGRVTMRGVNQGDYVQVGQILMALVQPNVWVTANFKETQLHFMKPGQPVDIHIDTYPDRRFEGVVDSIQHGKMGRPSSLLPRKMPRVTTSRWCSACR